MKNLILYILLLIIVSCSSKKELQNKEVIYYGKTACLGKCPVFDFYVFSDGKVIYEGIKNVDKKGKHNFKISKNKLEEIQNEVMKLNSESNTKSVRDIPNTIIKFSGKRIVVQNLQKIKKLDILIQEIILSK